MSCHGKRALDELMSRKNCTTSPSRLGHAPGTKQEKLI